MQDNLQAVTWTESDAYGMTISRIFLSEYFSFVNIGEHPGTNVSVNIWLKAQGPKTHGLKAQVKACDFAIN